MRSWHLLCAETREETAHRATRVARPMPKHGRSDLRATGVIPIAWIRSLWLNPGRGAAPKTPGDRLPRKAAVRSRGDMPSAAKSRDDGDPVQNFVRQLADYRR